MPESFDFSAPAQKTEHDPMRQHLLDAMDRFEKGQFRAAIRHAGEFVNELATRESLHGYFVE